VSHESHSQLAIHPVDPGEHAQLLQRQQVARRVRITAIVVLLLLALGAARTVISRRSNARALEVTANEGAAL
jgi:hypothetical protein